MKKVISLLIAIIMVMGFAQAIVYGAAAFPDFVMAMSRVEWSLDENGVMTIQSDITAMPSFVSSWGYYGPWYGNTNIKKIILPDSITHIGSYMFAKCTNLTEVVLPKNLEELADNVFYGCTSLEKITISDENACYKTIDGVLFDKAGEVLFIYPVAKKDSEYTMPEGVTSINSEAFAGCEFIEKVNFPSTVGTINKYTFAKCVNLDNVVIPESVTYMAEDVFSGCTKLGNITVAGCVYMKANPFNNTAFYNNPDNWDGDGLYINRHLLDVSSDATEYTIKPDTVSIAGNVFALNKNIKSLIVPGSVKCIGDNAFASSGLEEILLEEGLEIIGNHAFHFSRIENITFPNSLKIIGGNAFEYSKLKAIVIPDNVIDIGEEAFRDCEYIESVTFGNGLNNIGDGAFLGCDNLTEVTIPDNVKTMASNAFGECNNLSVVYIGSGLNEVTGYTFRKCGKLVNVHVSENNPYMTSVDGVVFDKACEKLLCYPSGRSTDTYTIPNTVKTIAGNYSFNTTNLKVLNLPTSVEKIEKTAFLNCSNLTQICYAGTREEFEKIEIGDNNSYFEKAIVEFVDGGQKNIYGNLHLEEKDDKIYVTGLIDTSAEYVEIPGEINGKPVEIQSSAFRNTQLQKVVLDEKIKNIPSSAFSGCKYLKEINLENIETIESCAFMGCESLKEINLLNIKSWSGITEKGLNEDGTIMYFYYDQNLFRYDVYSIMTVFYGAKIDTLRIKWPEVNFDEGAETLPALFINCTVDKVIFENFTMSPSIAEFKSTGTMAANPRWQSSVDLVQKNSNIVIYGNDENARLYAEKIGVPFKALMGVTVNGKLIDADGCLPYIKNDRTMVPMRAIFEALGATVTWDNETKTAIGVKGDTEVRITIGENVLYKNGETIELDVTAEIKNDRTMVPVRAISEAFGCKVEWNGETKSVIIEQLAYEYEIHNSYVSIKKYTGNDEKVVIPDEIEGLPVTQINAGTFSKCENLKEIVFGKNVEKINHMAVSGCASLESVTLLNPYTYIAPHDLGTVYEDGKPPYTPHGVMMKFDAFYETSGFTVYGYKNSTAEKRFSNIVYLEENEEREVEMVEIKKLAELIEADEVTYNGGHPNVQIKRDRITLRMRAEETQVEIKEYAKDETETTIWKTAVEYEDGTYYVPMEEVMKALDLIGADS